VAKRYVYKGERSCSKMDYSIEINTAIFPMIMSLALGKPIQKDNDGPEISPSGTFEADIKIDLPRGAYLLYLQKVAVKNELERRLLQQYAYGLTFTDEDYSELLNLIMTPVNRKWNQSPQQDILTPFGVQICRDKNGNQSFELIEDAIPAIKAETWECIILDLLKKPTYDIISCFDFNATFIRKSNDYTDKEELKIHLGAWKFSTDDTEQSLSNALRAAFMFTLVGYYFGDLKDQYKNFLDYFEAEFHKRVSLVYGMWASRGTENAIKYIPLYDSFYNLDGINKDKLISILKAILDNDDIALDEKQTLKNRLIDGAGTFHTDIDPISLALEQNLIKPAVNFILLREKAKETLASAQILCKEGKYTDCANRCYYAMMFSLKALLENQGKLADWKANELKEAETHNSLEKGFDDLVSEGLLDSTDKAAFEYVKEQRWKCDYSLYKFERLDAENCIKKTQAFYTKIETITA